MAYLRKVEILFIGDELLLGIRTNSHLTFMGEQLARHGLELVSTHEIRDSRAEIAAAFRSSWERADLVIVTGGLGPTDDDLTREALSESLGRPLVFEPVVREKLEAYFARRDMPLSENNLSQCYRLEGAELLPNPNGTAPGQWLEADGKILAVLPGPAREMRPMFLDQVLPRLAARGWSQKTEAYLQIRTSGIGESQVATDLRPVFSKYNGRLQVAYCAHEGIVDIRLSSVAQSLSADDIRRVGQECQELLGDSFAGFGDTALPALVLKQLYALGRSLAVAESCTGGLLASHLTDVPGSSRVFRGGIVTYTTQSKVNLLDIPDSLIEQHGAVSPECAAAMATAAAEMFEADYALSVTGFAGPEAGNEPVGTIYIGFHSPLGVWSRRVLHPGSRQSVKLRAVNAALDFLRRKLIKYEVHDLLDQMRA